jgi:hypothetical protein
VRSGARACLLVLQLGPALRSAAAADLSPADKIADQFRLGERAWKASCPRPTEDGGCTELRTDAPRPHLVAIDRDPALAAEARRRFLAVEKLWRRLGGRPIRGASERDHLGRAPTVHVSYAELFGAKPGQEISESITPPAGGAERPDQSGAAHAAAGAAFYLAEAQWEAYVRIEPPPFPSLGRDGTAGDEALRKEVPRWQRRTKVFIRRKIEQLAATRQMYLSLLAMRQAPFEIAAIARIGQLYRGFDDALALASRELWRSRSKFEQLDVEDRNPLDEKAVAAFEICFDTAAKSDRYDDWFRLCAHELTELRPGKFPPANEFVPEAHGGEGRIVPIPVVSRIGAP